MLQSEIFNEGIYCKNLHGEEKDYVSEKIIGYFECLWNQTKKQ